ncbi:hypothetical protein NIES4071_56250 [Calothrix sp. NIES-4071]|nr:hypothetical protein NIES4071_56250 [Calothrix sp. NIES-4071]BAZ59932.1 hypothetical protein NIES4105_56200 [Calothrix sp. NIES-4105]
MTEEAQQKENRHAVTSPEYCKKMASKYGWKLKRIEKKGIGQLPYECVFEGEQTSFEDTTNDN